MVSQAGFHHVQNSPEVFHSPGFLSIFFFFFFFFWCVTFLKVFIESVILLLLFQVLAFGILTP